MHTLAPVPNFTELKLVHSTNMLIDLTHISRVIPDASLAQMGNLGITLEMLFGSSIIASQQVGPIPLNDINAFRMQIMNNDPTFEPSLLERHQMRAMSGLTVTISKENFVSLVWKALFDIYNLYNHLYWTFFTELGSVCSAMGYSNLNYRIHSVAVSNAAANVAVGCYQ